MVRIARFYRLLNILSLDVTIGAVIGASFFADLLTIRLTFQELVCLALTVWLIYTTDHLLDARRIQAKAVTQRHRFHQVYFKILFVTVGLAFLIIILLLFSIRSSIVFWGFGLIAGVFVYLFVQHKLGFLKEFCGSLLYVCGILLPSVSLLQLTPLPSFVFFIVLFVITVLINLILFSWFTYDQDRAEYQNSFSVLLGISATRRMLYVLFTLQLILGCYCILSFLDSFFIVVTFFFMNSILFLIFYKPLWFVEGEKYRITGDAVFLIPLFYICVQ